MTKLVLILAVLMFGPFRAMAAEYNFSSTVYIPESSEFGPDSVYPITFDVSDGGSVADINIALVGLNHAFFGDLVAGLRAPDGTSVYFLGGAGINGGNYSAGGSYVFDGQAVASIAEYPATQLIAPGSYRESVYRTDGPAGNPDPFGFGTYSTSLTAFNGHSAAGVWELFLLDQYDGNKGLMRGAVLSVSAVAVPEPTSWAMMIIGLAACGGALRRSRFLRPAAQGIGAPAPT